jgi:hypothetical protein
LTQEFRENLEKYKEQALVLREQERELFLLQRRISMTQVTVKEVLYSSDDFYRKQRQERESTMGQELVSGEVEDSALHL